MSGQMCARSARSGVDVYAEFEIDVHAVQPMDAISLMIDEPEKQMFDGGFALSAQATRHGEAAAAEYCFYYRIVGSTRWSIISPGWTPAGSVTFVPKAEGEYEFMAAARAEGRRTADVSATSDMAFGIYFTDLPVNSVTMNTPNTADMAESGRVILTAAAEVNPGSESWRGIPFPLSKDRS